MIFHLVLKLVSIDCNKVFICLLSDLFHCGMGVKISYLWTSEFLMKSSVSSVHKELFSFAKLIPRTLLVFIVFSLGRFHLKYAMVAEKTFFGQTCPPSQGQVYTCIKR